MVNGLPLVGKDILHGGIFLLKIHSYCFLFVSKCLNLTDFYFLCSMRIEELYKFDYLSIKLQFEAVAVNVSM